jgi:succinate dehydrogenase flavin-adding protein (antitoxin of CptAB toxin-antitoxin module)
MNNKKKENVYDVSGYNDNELYELLDLNNPTDRELEAKIIFMIRKYSS